MKKSKNALVNTYISQVKDFFPILTKQEKNYLQNLSVQLEKLVEENKIQTIGELYKQYDEPQDVVSHYYSTFDTSELIKHMGLKQYIRRFVYLVVFLAIVSVIATIGIHFLTQWVFLQEEILFLK